MEKGGKNDATTEEIEEEEGVEMSTLDVKTNKCRKSMVDQIIEALRFFKRFIDDCIGVWRGTKRSFDSFVNQLNKEAAKYGIKFPIKEIQFGKSVEATRYLSVTKTNTNILRDIFCWRLLLIKC